MTDPTTPNRDLDTLRPDFREKLEAFLQAVQAAMPGYDVAVHEAVRSPERQAHLYASGRTRPGPILTNTLDSNHLHGLAADWHLSRNGRATWDASLYQRAYELVPPEKFGLETLAPFEWVHVQLADADNRRDETPVEPPARLLLVFDAAGVEVARVALPDGADVLLRASADGRRVYVRADAP